MKTNKHRDLKTFAQLFGRLACARRRDDYLFAYDCARAGYRGPIRRTVVFAAWELAQ